MYVWEGFFLRFEKYLAKLVALYPLDISLISFYRQFRKMSIKPHRFPPKKNNGGYIEILESQYKVILKKYPLKCFNDVKEIVFDFTTIKKCLEKLW